MSRASLLAILFASLFSGSSLGAAPPAPEPKPALLHSDTVTKLLAARLPKTKISKVDCSQVQGLCEVQAGQNLFYIDGSARYLVIGRVYDMETHQDLTAAHLLDLNPDLMLAGAPSAQGGGVAETALAGASAGHAVPVPSAAAGAAPLPTKVSLASLPANGGITWGGKGPSVTVFSDFHCGYCRALHGALKAMGVRVTERPISVLGTRAISNAVICADDKQDAVEKAYGDQEVAPRACDTTGLDANEHFAREHGFTGTPVIVRADGAVVLGYRPREFLEAWLKGAA